MNPHESWPYRYPPTVAAVMQPLSCLPLGWSYVLFTLIQLSVLALILRFMQQNFSLLRQRPGWLWAIGGSGLGDLTRGAARVCTTGNTFGLH